MRIDGERTRRRRKGAASTTLRQCAVLGTAGLTLVVLTGCNGEENPTEPPATASVAVTSPVGDRLAVDRSVQLQAEATDASGNVVSGLSFTWSSSDTDVASVDAGLLRGLGTGSSTIAASADGVSGDLAIEVIAVDFEAIRTALDDPFTTALVAALTDAPRDLVNGALEDCATAMDRGHVTNLDTCFDELGGTSSSEPTDRALLAVLTLLTGHAARQVETS